MVEAGQVHLGEGLCGEKGVAGGGLTGCEAALHLAREGKKVTVVEMVDERAAHRRARYHEVCPAGAVPKHGARVITEVKIEEITAAGS